MHDHPDFPSVIGGWCIHFTQQNLVHRMSLSSQVLALSLSRNATLYEAGHRLSRERSSCVTEKGRKPFLEC